MRTAFATFRRVALLVLALLTIGSTPAAAGAAFVRAPESTGFEATLEPPPDPPEGWVTEEALFARVHAAEADRRTATRLLRHTTEAVPRIAQELGVAPGRTMDVYLAPDEATFDAMQPGQPPDWADGTAWPHRGLVYLHSPRARDGIAAPLEQVLDHEIVHVLLGRAFGPRPVPRWLQEGVAQIVAREYRPETTRALARGVLGDSLLDIDELTGRWPADPIKAQLAYAQSADLIAFLRNRWGDDALHTLIREMSRGRTVGQAMHAATGLSVHDVDAAWRGEVEGSLLWLQPLVSDEMIFGVASVLFLVAGVATFRRRRRRLLAWAEEEARHVAWVDAMRSRLASLAPPDADPDHLGPRSGDEVDPLRLVH